MAKKMFLNRVSAVPTTQVPSVSSEEPESEEASSIRNSPVSGITEQQPFILDVTSKTFVKFNATGRRFLKFRSTGEEHKTTV